LSKGTTWRTWASGGSVLERRHHGTLIDVSHVELQLADVGPVHRLQHYRQLLRDAGSVVGIVGCLVLIDRCSGLRLRRAAD
jgi:hypothetical protein